MRWQGGVCLALMLSFVCSACQPTPQVTPSTRPSFPSPEITLNLASPLPPSTMPGGVSPSPEITSAFPQGILPIGLARGLVGEVVTLEGTATMYSGGFYAGSGNVNFYIQDESGGIQVQVFGGEGRVEVAIGARVRVHGRVDTYRGAIQIVPDKIRDDLTITAVQDEREITPTTLSLAEASNPQVAPLGRLVQVSGTLLGFSESSDNYWMGLSDEQGHRLSIYIDKMTDISLEGFQAGTRYRLIGILEGRDGIPCLYPRQQTDLAEVFPSALALNLQVEPLVRPGTIFTTTLSVVNHSQHPLSQVQIEMPLPSSGAQLNKVLDGGWLQNERLQWMLPSLEAAGGNASLQATWHADEKTEAIFWQGHSATAEGWSEAVVGETRITFIGTEIPIWAVQGRTFASPMLMERVTLRGIVSGVFPGLGGFWVQNPQPDDDPSTSEGIFVDTGGMEIALLLGDEVSVSGEVRETYQQTTLLIGAAGDVRVLSRGNPLPPAQELDPPAEEQAAQAYYEALEGMLVQVQDEAVAISPTSKYGEFALVLSQHGIERIGSGTPSGWRILVDDGDNRVHRDRSGLPYVVYSGDRVSNVLGPLAFSFGQYKIEPLYLPKVVHQARELPSLPMVGKEEFRLMTWNTKNLFDPHPPHPQDLPMPGQAEYEIALAKVVGTILAAGAPQIIALQEVENLGVLEALASHPDLLPFAYGAVLIEGNDRRGIDVGFLVRQDSVEILEIRQVASPKELTTRPPLLLRLRLGEEPEGVILYALNNHFTALSEGEEESQPRQAAQAAWNAEIVRSLLTTEPNACLAVMGDLNVFPDSAPIRTLLKVGLDDPFKHLPETERYTYIYQGISQTLDYILVTPCLMGLLQRADILRLNADFPPPPPGDPSPEHKSDHDPVVLTFSYP